MDEPSPEDAPQAAPATQDEPSRVDAALRESEARFQTLVENMSDIVVELDESASICWLSPSVSIVLGREPKDLIRRPIRPIMHPDDIAEMRSGLDRAYLEAETVDFTYRLRHADGRWRWIEGSGRCFDSSSGQRHFVGVGRDVTEYKTLLAKMGRQHRADQQIMELSHRFVELAPGEIDSAIRTALDAREQPLASSGLSSRPPRGGAPCQAPGLNFRCRPAVQPASTG
jgi:PAS domain S-box-containing protein